MTDIVYSRLRNGPLVGIVEMVPLWQNAVKPTLVRLSGQERVRKWDYECQHGGYCLECRLFRCYYG